MNSRWDALPAWWFTEEIPRYRLMWSSYIDRKTDASRDSSIKVDAVFRDNQADGVRPLPCGSGLTVAKESGDLVVIIGTGGLGEKIRPIDVAILCCVWKHEMEHVRQMTDYVVHVDAADKRIALEMLAMYGNEHIYLDNYGSLAYENRAHFAQFKDAPEMIRTVFGDLKWPISESDMESFLVGYAENIRDSYVISSGNPFRPTDKFESLQDVLDSLDARYQEILDGAPIYVDEMFEAGDVWLPTRGMDVFGDYFLSDNLDKDVESLIKSPDTSGMDVIRCMAAVNSWREPVLRRQYTVVEKDDFVCDGGDGLDARLAVGRSLPLSEKLSSPERQRKKGISLHDSTANQRVINTEEFYL